MLYKLFGWAYSVLLIPLLYGLGFASWVLAPSHLPHKLFYAVGAFLVLGGFIWSLGWLWTYRVFRRTSARYGAHERRTIKAREKETNYLSLATAVLVILFLGTGRQLLGSYKLHSLKKKARVEVFLSDTSRLKARSVPFQARPDRAIDMMFAMNGIPDKDVLLNDSQTSIPMDVVIRNTSAVTVSNAHVKINSNVPIIGVTEGLSRLSARELGANIAELKPSSGSAEEHVLSLKIPVPDFTTRASFFITIEGDNLDPFAAAGKLVILQSSHAGAVTSSTTPLRSTK